MKTLVIVLGETRAAELTFQNFKKNVIDELEADLCICIGVKPGYDTNNPFYQLAKYRFLYDEPDDYAKAFDEAYAEFLVDAPVYETLEGMNALYGKVKNVNDVPQSICDYGIEVPEDSSFNTIVQHSPDFEDDTWKSRVYGLNTDDFGVAQKNVTTYKKHLPWREFLKIKNQFLGGILDEKNQHPGSAGILIFFRWFLLKKLKENGLMEEYDHFVITRSDYLYQLPHPKVTKMSTKYIWIPDGENYGGYTDRHAILSKSTIEPYLNILNMMFSKSNEYFMKMKGYEEWNLEKLIYFHLLENGMINQVREFPYVMFTVRPVNGTTRWAQGIYIPQLGFNVKYMSELTKSSQYQQEFIKTHGTIDEFYQPLYRSRA